MGLLSVYKLAKSDNADDGGIDEEDRLQMSMRNKGLLISHLMNKSVEKMANKQLYLCETLLIASLSGLHLGGHPFTL